VNNSDAGEAAKAVVRRNTEEVQGGGDFAVFDELFADDFVDHTPQPGTTPDKDGVRHLYTMLRQAFPDFRADIHWQAVDGNLVTTYKVYHGTHRGPILGVAPTGRQIHFESVDVMRVQDGKITDHWGVGNLYSLMQQLGGAINSQPEEANTQGVATSDLDRMIDDWAMAWSSTDSDDPERVLALFADDCVFEDVTFGVVARGKEELRSFVKQAFAAVPDFKYDVRSRLITGRWAAIEWTMSGTHKGDAPGIPATGKRFSSVRGASILEIEGDKIRRESDYWDAATFMQQVGLLPSKR
jgi:steroid delta-isomerase-like uncharacterized protein